VACGVKYLVFDQSPNHTLLPMRVGVLGEFGCHLVAHGSAPNVMPLLAKADCFSYPARYATIITFIPVWFHAVFDAVFLM
jgi:hypothetical protein